MSQNHPFQFGAASGQPPAVQTSQNYTQPSDASEQHSQPSPMDMSVLNGISPEQLAAIARLFQSGQLQMPPPVPTSSTQIAAPPQSAPVVTETSSISDATVNQPAPSLIRDMGTEERKVNESEPDIPAESRDFLRPPPTGPKNRSVSPRESNQRRSSPRPPLPGATMSDPSQLRFDAASHPTIVAYGNRTIAKNDAAKEFVLEIVKAGYSYNDIAPEVRNPQSLIRMFEELNIPLTPPQSSAQLSRTTAITAVPSQAPAPVNSAVAHEETRRASAVKPPAPVKAAPKDRREYLAQLQAAKNKKADTATDNRNDYLARLQAAKTKKTEGTREQSAASKLSLKPETATTASGSEQVSNQSPPPVASSKATPAAKQPLSSDKAAMNALVKQRLQALKAQQAAQQIQNAAQSSDAVPQVAASSSQVILSPAQEGLGAGIANISTRIAQSETQHSPSALPHPQNGVRAPVMGEPTVSPTPRTPSTPFGSLPGLFMFGANPSTLNSSSPSHDLPQAQPTNLVHLAQTSLPPTNTTSSPQIQQVASVPAPVSTLRKRPVASDFDDTSARPGPVKRLFGQSRNASEDESLVIEVSDAEDEDDVTEPEPQPEISSKNGPQTRSFRDVAPLRDFPPKHTFQVQTSAPGTPGGITYEQKMKEIEEFKRRIAEKEKRQKANGKLAISSDGPAPAAALENPGVNNPKSSPSPPLESKVFVTEDAGREESDVDQGPGVAEERSHSTSTDRPVSTMSSTKQQEKERLRRRLLQLEHEEDFEDDDEAEDDESDEYSPTHEPEHTLPGAISLSHSPPNALQLQANGRDQQSSQPHDETHASPSEEGEISDDSMSNFYDVQETQHVDSQDGTQPLEHTAWPQTPTSAVSESRDVRASGVEVPSICPAPALATENEYQLPETSNEDAEMDLDGDNDLNNLTPEGSSSHQSEPGDQLVDIESNALTPVDATGITDKYKLSDASLQDDPLEDGHPVQTSATHAETFPRPPATNSNVEPFISNPKSAETPEVVMADDGLAPEIQPTFDQESAPSDPSSTQARHFFTPYQSPFQGFKDYRYHPEYLDTVPGGHRSISYSYNIDPQTSLCPYETAGGKCNDSTCPYQHFESLVLSDTELLKMMGTKHVPANTPNELKRWNEGLGHVVRELRNTNLGKDANAIAARIAEYRREFVGDDASILNLG